MNPKKIYKQILRVEIFFYCISFCFSAEGNFWEIYKNQSYEFDTRCFLDHLRTCRKTGKDLDSKDYEYEEARVTLRMFERRPDEKKFKIISSHEEIIEKGSIFVLEWENYHKIGPGFQRNLTIAFDGESFCAATGQWEERLNYRVRDLRWTGCENHFSTGYLKQTSTFYKYDALFDDSKSERIFLEYQIDAQLRGPPAPDYDASCVPFHKHGLNLQNRVFNIRHLGEADNCKAPREYFSQTHKIPVGEDLVLQVVPHECSHEIGFHGCKIRPRNLTLWVDDTNKLNMAMAEVVQRYTVGRSGPVFEEKWKCSEVYYHFDGSGNMELTFTTFETFNLVNFTSVACYDTIIIRNGATNIGDKVLLFLSVMFVLNII